MWILHLGAFFALSLSSCCWARDYTFTLVLKSGTSECFYDYIHEGAFLEIEYQVSVEVVVLVGPSRATYQPANKVVTTLTPSFSQGGGNLARSWGYGRVLPKE